MNDKSKTKVFIAEDHKLFREGLKAILEGNPDLEVVGEARDGLEAIRLIKKTKPDLLILDLSMPRLNGISVIRDIRREFADLKILALTIHESDPFVRESFEAGVNGYCIKDASLGELHLAIETLLQNQIYISPAIGSDIMSGYLRGRESNEENV